MSPIYEVVSTVILKKKLKIKQLVHLQLVYFKLYLRIRYTYQNEVEMKEKLIFRTQNNKLGT